MTSESFFIIFSVIFLAIALRDLILSIISGFENIILIIIIFICLKKLILRKFTIITYLLIYSIVSCFFVVATYNLGVAIRQKWFFLIPLFFILLVINKLNEILDYWYTGFVGNTFKFN